MWVKRSPEEVTRWHELTHQEGRSHGLTIAIPVWLLLVLFGTFGIRYFRFGIVFQQSVPGGFWLRLPIFAVLGFVFSYWIYRIEVRKEVAKANRRTRCPGCGEGGERPAGSSCSCGVELVHQGTMKWVEEHS